MSCGYTSETKSILMYMECNSLAVTKIDLCFFYKENEGGLEINFCHKQHYASNSFD